MPWDSLADVPSSIRALGLRWANRWGEIYDAAMRAGKSSGEAARIAWEQVGKEQGEGGI